MPVSVLRSFSSQGSVQSGVRFQRGGKVETSLRRSKSGEVRAGLADESTIF
jgi:hypothetical protein